MLFHFQFEMGLLKLYKSFNKILCIFGCIGFDVDYDKEILLINYRKCIYTISMYTVLIILFLNNPAKEIDEFSTTFESLRSVVAMAYLINVLGFLLPPIFTILSVFTKTRSQILFIGNLLSFMNKVKSKLLHLEWKSLEKSYSKMIKLLISISFLTPLYFIVLSYFYLVEYGFKWSLLIRLTFFANFACISILITLYIISIINFLRTLAQCLKEKSKGNLNSNLRDLCDQLFNLIANFNDAFGVLYLGAYLYVHINYFIVIYYVYNYIVEIDGPEQSKSSVIILLYLLWMSFSFICSFILTIHCENLSILVR